MNKEVALILLMAALLQPIAAIAGATVQSQISGADVKEIHATVDRVRAAILSVNTQALLQEISPGEGLACTDSAYTYPQVMAYLNDRDSILYKSLFDSSKFRTECGAGYPESHPAISDAEFYLRANREIRIESVSTGWVKVTIQSPIQSHFEHWLYLHKEGEVWKVGGESFVIGECICG